MLSASCSCARAVGEGVTQPDTAGASRSDGVWRAAGVAATGLGWSALVVPAQLSSAFGLPRPDSGGRLAWRLFGVRTAVIGAAIVAGVPDARRALVPVQAMDQLVFAAAALSGDMPRRTGVQAMTISALLIACGVVAARR